MDFFECLAKTGYCNAVEIITGSGVSKINEQFKYAWEDILDNKSKHFILFVQIAIALILFSFTMSVIFNLKDYESKLNDIMNVGEVFFLVDHTDDSKLSENILNAEDGEKRLFELYTFIKENPDFNTYTGNTQFSFWADDIGVDSSFIQCRHGDEVAYNCIQVDQKLIDVFNLQCIEGQLFSADDFKDTGDVIPIVLGYDFRKWYNLGDIIITDSWGSDQSFQVIGFLDKASFFIDPLKGDEVFWLDKFFVIPLQPDTFNTDLCLCDGAIMSTFFIVDDSAELRGLQEKSNQLDLYTFEFRSFSEQMQHISYDNALVIKSIGLMMIITLLFSLIGIISNLIQFINTHMNEFAIHMLCGSQMKLIIARILWQVLILIFIADIIVLIIHKWSIVTLLTVLFSLLVTLAIILYPAIKLSKTPMSDMIRRSE